MPVFYVIREKKNPLEPQSPPKFYAQAKAWDHIDRKTLLKDIVRHTSLTQHEAAAGIDYLFEAIPNYLSLGLTVQLGDLGYFKCTIQSEGDEDPDKVTVDSIKNIALKFVPGKEIREQVRNLPVQEYPML